MIVCSNCSSGQFVQITRSRVYFKDGKRPTEISEEYECQLCDSTGKLEIWEEDGVQRTSITGDVEQTDDQPRVSP